MIYVYSNPDQSMVIKIHSHSFIFIDIHPKKYIVGTDWDNLLEYGGLREYSYSDQSFQHINHPHIGMVHSDWSRLDINVSNSLNLLVNLEFNMRLSMGIPTNHSFLLEFSIIKYQKPSILGYHHYPPCMETPICFFFPKWIHMEPLPDTCGFSSQSPWLLKQKKTLS